MASTHSLGGLQAVVTFQELPGGNSTFTTREGRRMLYLDPSWIPAWHCDYHRALQRKSKQQGAPMPRVCLGYLCGEEWDLLELSLQTMLGYSWVRQILIVDTTGQHEPQPTGRVVKHSQDFGQGPLFDELSARNYLLRELHKLAQTQDCEWLLLCDPDEFFLPGTADVLGRARPEHEAVLFDCWHACDPLHFVADPRLQFSAGDKLLFDPHPRAVRVGTSWRYIPNALAGFRSQLGEHCYLPIPFTSLAADPNYCHVHVKHMFKTSPGPQQRVEPLPANIVRGWPAQYLQRLASMSLPSGR